MSFICQQCKQPLQVCFLLPCPPEIHEIHQLDASLVDLAPSAYDIIVASLPPPRSSNLTEPSEADKLAHLPAPTSSKLAWQRSVQVAASRPQSFTSSTRGQSKQPRRPQLQPNESFVLLQDSIVHNTPTAHTRTKSRHEPAQVPSEPLPQDEPTHPNPSPLSHHLRSTLRLLNLISSRTDIDHPLCAECTDILLSSLTRQLEETKKERDGYIAFEKEVRKEKEREKDNMSAQDAEKHISKLIGEERGAIEALREAEREKEQLNEELQALELEEKVLEEEEAE
jgi:beclin 1